MLANLTMDLIFTNIDSEHPPIDTPLMICLTRSCCSIMSKGLLNSSVEHLVIYYRRCVASSIGILFTSDRRMLQARNCSINSDMFSPTILEGPSWENCLSQVFRDWTTASDMKKILLSIILRRTMLHCSIIVSKSNSSLNHIFSSSIEEAMISVFIHYLLSTSCSTYVLVSFYRRITCFSLGLFMWLRSYNLVPPPPSKIGVHSVVIPLNRDLRAIYHIVDPQAFV